jgi:hypothetical protein
MTAKVGLALIGSLLLAGTIPAAAQRQSDIAKGLPAAMIGTWALEAADCADPDSNFLARVSANAVAFYASYYSFARVTRLPDGSWLARAKAREEGEAVPRPGRIELRLLDDNRLRVRQGGGNMEYLRCH